METTLKNSEQKIQKITQIIKRNKKIVLFDPKKITDAIEKAGRETKEFDRQTAQRLTIRVLHLLHQTATDHIPNVEEIQDLVEEVLIASTFRKTAKAYIIYRDQHAKIREMASQSQLSLIQQYLDKLDWQVKENSNMSYSLQGMHNYISSEVSKLYWLNKIYPPHIKKAHLEGDFHIHDLGILSVYCVGWDLQDLLMHGFQGAVGKVQSAPAKHFRSALGQIVNFFYTMQGEAAGAQAFSNFDTLLAPFIRYDKLDYTQVKQAMQEFIFNINVPTRVGFQTPFTNITMDLKPAEIYADTPVIIGGNPQKETYKEFQEEMDMLNKAFWEVMMQGDAKGRVFTFPIPTYNMTKDFDWDNPNYELLWQVTGKYGIPYFANFINSDMDPKDARSMCCRLRLDTKQLAYRGGGLFGSNPLTGSIGVVTINLPRIGYLAKDENEFFSLLEEKMELAKESLEIKRKIIEKYMDMGLYPYSKYYLRQIKERFDCYWKNHFSTIGLIGMNEAIYNLLQTTINSEVGKTFSLRVMDFMREKITKYQEQTNNNYNLEATPGEGTTYRLALLDKKHYPDILCASDIIDKAPEVKKPYYTNSTHLPVHSTDDAFEALDHQDALQTKYTGGTVLHLFLGESINEPQSVKNFVHKVCQQYHLPYISITPTFSICPNHGYIHGEEHVCSQCDALCEVYSRVVGYLRPVSQWNDGKVCEFHQRTTYNGPQAC